MMLRLAGLLVMLAALSLPLLRADDQSVEVLASRWAPPPSEFIDLQGQLVHLRDEGPRDDPVPVLLLHGTASSLHGWDGWVKALQGQRRLLRIDLPGFGLTGPWTGTYAGRPYQGETWARFVLDLLDRLKLQRVVVIGHSVGGEVAWRLAALAPQRVDRLVLVSASGLRIAPLEVPLGWELARTPVAGRMVEWVLTRGMVRKGLTSVVGDPRSVSAAQVDRYFSMALRSGNRQALADHLRTAPWQQGEEHVRGVTAPTLVLWGGRDRITPPAAAERFAADIPLSAQARFADLGHLPHEEDPVRTAVPVREFLGLAP